MKTPCKILKTFQYSEDGIVVLTADKDKVVDIPDHLISGFEKEGLLRPAKAGSAPAPASPKDGSGKPEETDETRRAVEIPENWREIDWTELRPLAASVSPTPVRSKADAEAAIEAELKIRADLKAAVDAPAGNAS